MDRGVQLQIWLRAWRRSSRGLLPARGHNSAFFAMTVCAPYAKV